MDKSSSIENVSISNDPSIKLSLVPSLLFSPSPLRVPLIIHLSFLSPHSVFEASSYIIIIVILGQRHVHKCVSLVGWIDRW